MFNPRPRIQAVPITSGQNAWVVDEVLLDPGQLVDFAAQQPERFADSPHNAYPGPELRLPDVLLQPLSAFFSQHLRERLGARRVQRATARLSLTTRAPHALQPRQSLCHVDRLEATPQQTIAATVLYLFDRPELGGTSFFVPRRPIAEIAALIRDSAALDAAAFEARHGIAPGYMVDGNAYFDRVATVSARFNRLVAYNGAIFHSGDIRRPELLSDDVRSGRLSLNGFFVCSRPFGG